MPPRVVVPPGTESALKERCSTEGERCKLTRAVVRGRTNS